MIYPTDTFGRVAPAETRRIPATPPNPCWLLNLDQIEKETGFLDTPELTDPSSASSSTYAFTTDHVLYSKLRPNLNKVVCPDRPGLCTTELIRMRPDPKRLRRAFLTFYLRSEYYMGFARQVVAGAKMPRMVMDRFWQHEIPLPPLPEQDRIVEILDQADALRQQRRQADALSQRILPALFHEMFGALPLDEKRLGDHLSFLTSGSRGWAEHYAEAGALFIRIQNVGKITLSLDDCAFVVPPKNKEAERTKVMPRDVLLSITADLGRTSVIPDEFGDGYINQHLAILRSSSLNPYFLAAFLESHEGKRQIGGLNRAAVKAGLNFSDIRSVQIPLASLNKQKAFEERVLSLHSTQSKSSTSAATLETLFQTLLHRAFDGSLTAKWREGQAKELLQEMKRKANKLP